MNFFTYQTIITIGVTAIIAGIVKKVFFNSNSQKEKKSDLEKRKKAQTENIQEERKLSVSIQSLDQSFVNQQPEMEVEQNIEKKKVYVMFGTQMGQAERFAMEIEDNTDVQKYFTITVVDIDEFDTIDDFDKAIIIYIISTHYDGEPADNTEKFFKYLKSKTSEKEKCLSNQKFAVFGLGSKDYSKFNVIAIQIDKMLEQLGAERFFEIGLGNDCAPGFIQQNFEDWTQKLYPVLNDLCKSQNNPITTNARKTSETQQQIKEKYILVKTNKPSIDLKTYENCDNLGHLQKQFVQSSTAKVLSIKEIRQNIASGKTKHLTIDLSNTKIQYKTADNLAIFPKNSSQIVKRISTYFNVNLNDVFEVQLNKPGQKFPFPNPLNVEDILGYFYDVTGTISISQLKQLEKLVKQNEKALSKITQWINNEDLLKKDIVDQMKTIMDIIEELNIKIEFYQFLEICPSLQARHYTISSSHLVNPQQCTITCSIVEDELKNKKIKTGVASQYFLDIEKNLSEMSDIKIFCQKSKFDLPSSKETSVTMIASGAGVAPFIGFLQHNNILFNNKEEYYKKMSLYFGCKYEQQDFIFANELKKYKQDGILQSLNCAFSRDQGNKVYVQHLIKNNTEEIYNQITNNGIFYLCGNISMGRDVYKVFQEILVEKRNVSQEQAKTIIEDMEENCQIIKELW